MMERGGRGRLRSRAAAPGRVRRAGRRKRGGWGSWPARHRACVSTTRVGAGREAFRVTAQVRSLSWPASRVLRGRDGPFPALAAGGIAARAALGAWSLGPAGWQSPSLPERAPRPPYAGATRRRWERWPRPVSYPGHAPAASTPAPQRPPPALHCQPIGDDGEPGCGSYLAGQEKGWWGRRTKWREPPLVRDS